MVCPETSQKIYVSLAVEKRSEIPEFFLLDCPHDGTTHEYRREDVMAEPTFGAPIGGTILGGLIGAIFGGPIGAIIGGGAGLALGSNAEQEERRKVQRFCEA